MFFRRFFRFIGVICLMTFTDLYSIEFPCSQFIPFVTSILLLEKSTKHIHAKIIMTMSISKWRDYAWIVNCFMSTAASQSQSQSLHPSVFTPILNYSYRAWVRILVKNVLHSGLFFRSRSSSLILFQIHFFQYFTIQFY